MIKNNGKNTDQNVTIKALEDHIDKPSKDERKDETNVHNGHIRGKRKSNDRTKTDNLKRPVANFSRTNGFQMISTSNILILSTLFGLVLTKNLGEITENRLVKTPLKRETNGIGDNDGLNTISYESTLINAFDCLDSALPS